MLRKFTILFLIALVGYSAFFVRSQEPKALMILNMENEAILPRNFRTANDSFKLNSSHFPTREGLDRLNISGSAQFSEASLGAIIKELGSPSSLYIVDLRQESHGFLNGVGVSWYAPRDWGNIDLNLKQIEQNEKQLLQDALKARNITIYHIVKKHNEENKLPDITSTPFVVERAATEQQIIAQYNLGYIRIPVTDHLRPTDENIDRFISFMRSLPKNRWVHIHCAAGAGRTTTFMVMYDMMLNAKNVSFDDIMKRQVLLGGLNLIKSSEKAFSWKSSYAEIRVKFLKDFYEYCRHNTDNFQESWSAYILKKQEAASAV